METAELKQETASQARQQLKQLSQELKPLVEGGEFDNINQALIATYTTDEHPIFKKFWDWKKEGYTILKGSKAFAVWAQPVQGKKKEATQDQEPDEYEYFPICFLFSNAQVRRKGNA